MAKIETKRLTLRPFVAADSARVVAILNDFTVSKWLHHIPHPFTPQDLRILGPKGESRWPDLAAIDCDGELVGGITTGEHLGYWIDPLHHGTGFASEAARAMVDYTFGRLGRTALESGYFVGNDRSAAILRKLGFVETGIEPRLCKARGKALPSANLVLTRTDWLASHGLPLVSDRLLIRPLSLSDVLDLRRIAGTDAVAPMLAHVQSPWSVEAAETWVTNSQFVGRLGFRLGVCDRDTGTLLGVVGVGHAPASLMYFVDPAHWGEGIASEACRMVLDYVFARFTPAQIEADVFTDNPASARVLEKLGFQQIGTGMGNSAARVDASPVILYRLRGGDYESVTR